MGRTQASYSLHDYVKNNNIFLINIGVIMVKALLNNQRICNVMHKYVLVMLFYFFIKNVI